MAKLVRKNQKLFAGSANNNGVFGSLQAGTKIYSNDVETIQSLPAYDQGWNAATVSSEKLPPLEELQSIQYAQSYQLMYQFQEGIPEWNAQTAYYIGGLVKVITTGGNFILYSSLTDNNVGNAPASSPTQWKIILDSSLANYIGYDRLTVGYILSAPNGIPSVSFSGSAATVTIKGGTQSIVPSGMTAANIHNNTSFVLENDSSGSFNLSTDQAWMKTLIGYIFYNSTTSTFLNYTWSDFYYGVQQPTVPSSASNYGLWFDTANNVYKATENKGSSWVEVPGVFFVARTIPTGSAFYLEQKTPLTLATEFDIERITDIMNKKISDIKPSITTGNFFMPNWSAPLNRAAGGPYTARRNCVVEVYFDEVSTREYGDFFINEVLHQHYANGFSGNYAYFWWYVPAGSKYRTAGNATVFREYPLIGV
jgi:hypothetical protein